MIIRIHDGVNFSYKFECFDPDGLRNGCQSAWRKIRAIRGENHMIANSWINNRIREIEKWKKSKKITDKNRDSINGHYIKLINDARRGRSHGKIQISIDDLLPENLYIQVREPFTEHYAEADLANNKTISVSNNNKNWGEIFDKCINTEDYLYNISGLIDFLKK